MNVDIIVYFLGRAGTVTVTKNRKIPEKVSIGTVSICTEKILVQVMEPFILIINPGTNATPVYTTALSGVILHLNRVGNRVEPASEVDNGAEKMDFDQVFYQGILVDT